MCIDGFSIIGNIIYANKSHCLYHAEMLEDIGKLRLNMSAYMMNVVYTSNIYVHESLILCTDFMCFVH